MRHDLKALSIDDFISCGLTAQAALKTLGDLDALLQDDDNLGDNPDNLPLLWDRLARKVLQPEHPFELHRRLFDATYTGWDATSQGPPPAWVPSAREAVATNAACFMHRLGLPHLDVSALHRLSIADPEAFWLPLLRELRIKFHVAPRRALQAAPSVDPDAARWLPGARLNIAEAALSGRDPDLPAIIWADEGHPEELNRLTRTELAAKVQQVADALMAWGLSPGDAVAVDMPMGVEAVIAYLGIILSGCTAVSIADSFAAGEIATRLHIAETKAVFTQDVIHRGGKSLPLYARVVEAGAPRTVVLPAAGAAAQPVVQLRDGDLTWHECLKLAGETSAVVGAPLRAHVADAYDVSNVLFSSGTTGTPKAIPWTHVTPLRSAADAFFHQDVRQGDVVAWPTSMGWMMGPWLVYAALFNGAAAALFLGSPLGREFGRFVAAAKVNVLGLVPSIARAWRASDCMRGLDWSSSLRCFSSSGEASSPEEYLWLMARGGYRPVIEYCGGTEIGGAFMSGTMLQPQAPGTFSTPTMGAQPVLLTGGRDGVVELVPAPCSFVEEEDARNQQNKLSFSEVVSSKKAGVVTGELALRVPMLGVSQRLLNADHHAVYFRGMVDGLRRHGDVMQLLPGGRCRAAGRCDDTFNLGGIKVSSVELETAVVECVPNVIEAAAVGVPPPMGGPDELVLFLVLRAAGGDSGRPTSENNNDEADLRKACQNAVSSRLNPLFRIGRVQVVGSLPRNASNKVMRRTLRERALKRAGGVQQGADAAKL